jgi:hypothetical protein
VILAGNTSEKEAKAVATAALVRRDRREANREAALQYSRLL